MERWGSHLIMFDLKYFFLQFLEGDIRGLWEPQTKVVLFKSVGEWQKGTTIDMHVGHGKVQGCVTQPIL